MESATRTRTRRSKRGPGPVGCGCGCGPMHGYNHVPSSRHLKPLDYFAAKRCRTCGAKLTGKTARLEHRCSNRAKCLDRAVTHALKGIPSLQPGYVLSSAAFLRNAYAHAPKLGDRAALPEKVAA